MEILERKMGCAISWSTAAAVPKHLSSVLQEGFQPAKGLGWRMLDSIFRNMVALLPSMTQTMQSNEMQRCICCLLSNLLQYIAISDSVAEKRVASCGTLCWSHSASDNQKNTLPYPSEGRRCEGKSVCLHLPRLEGMWPMT
jgi:hypothetical protein